MRYILLFLIFSLTACSATVDGANSVKIIAHRGDSSYAPEHTLAAYELAKEQGADYIELDLGMTKDGQLIAIHDDTVDRTTNGHGRVNSFSLLEIKKLDAGSWFNEKFPDKAKESYSGMKILTIEEVINKYGSSINYYIEIKKPNEYPGMIDELLRVLKSHKLISYGGTRGKVIIESFNSDSLKYIHNKYPNILLIQLGNFSTKEQLLEIAAYADGVGPSFSKMTKELVEEAHKKGLIVHCWTIDQQDDLKKLLEWDVDGVFTNNVRVAKKVIMGVNNL
ncbi:glycerophosphodiester phosphodiesterase [Neobacillus mesonae]|uniref:glycerophosphodiester phosphodiesterase n=1 Tax=Neobacillus mesonae TaxID=1193713 RepID=UPI002572A3ED|nr:glycerophosphodiester phosphodiesterase [Neobacillus mesonae]